MTRLCGAAILRPSGSGLLIVLASSTVSPDTPSSSYSSSSFSSPSPSDVDVLAALSRARIRTDCHCDGVVELGGHQLHYSVSVGEPCPLVFVVVSERASESGLALVKERAQRAIIDVQASVLMEAQLLMLLPQAADHELQPHIEPKLTGVLMAEAAKGSSGQPEKVDQLRQQVNDVRTVMSENIERILERGERLDNIEQRTDDLAASSATFKTTARRVQRKFCMLNAKWTIISIVFTLVVIAIVILIILAAAGVFDKK